MAISLDRCRQLLGTSYTGTEAELESLRDQLYILAGVMVEIAATRIQSGNNPSSPAQDEARYNADHEQEHALIVAIEPDKGSQEG